MRRSPWIVAAVALACGALAIVPLGLDRELLRALVATYIGAAIGFFVALYTDRLQRAEDEVRRRTLDAAADDRAQINADEVERKHRVAVLRLLREELGRVPAQMGKRQNRDHSNPPFDRLSDMLWRTLSASGELRWIRDLALLQKLASAYDLLEVEVYLERRWLESRADTGGAVTAAHRFFANQLTVHDRDTWRLACDACDAMDVALEGDGAERGEVITWRP
jgi:uncharacterized membrane protein YccC